MNRFKNWLTPPFFENDIEKNITAGFLNSILLTVMLGPIIFSISAIINQTNPSRSLGINIATLILMVSLLALLHKGYVKLAAAGTILTLFTLFTFVATLHTGISSPIFSGLILVVIIAGLLLGKRSTYLTAFLGACTGLLLHNLNKAELIPFANSLLLPEISNWIILSVFLGISAVFVAMSRSITSRVILEAERRLIEQQEAQNALRRREAILEAIRYAAEQFLKTDDWIEIIMPVLSRLGEATQISRAYIFEHHTDARGATVASQRFEWAAPSIEPQINNPKLQEVPQTAWKRWVKVLENQQIVFGPVKYFPKSEQAILKAQGILSILVVPIFVGEQWWGYIGFDDCDREREWSSGEIDALKAAANILGAAIERSRISITLQENAEQLRASEKTLRALLEAIPDAIFRIDRSGTFIDYIPAQDFETLAPAREFLGKKVDVVLPPELAELTRHHFTKALDSNLIQTFEYSLITDGDLKYFEARMAKTDADSVLAIVRDMTARIEAKKRNDEMLTVLERRNTQLRIAADVAKTCSSILDPDLLVQQAVDLIQRGFELYYVGLFLVDTAGQTAILIAGSGEAGKRLVADGHHLKLEEASMVSWSMRNGQARIAQHADLDKVRYSNPHLPDTCSELALPLISRGRVIGALTVQDTQEGAFSEVDIAALQTMTDQLATAVENANLFEEAQKEIAERQRVEKELEQERNFAVQVMNALGQGVFVTNQKNEFEYVNPAFSRMLGRKPGDLLGKIATDVAYPDDVDKMKKGRALRFKGEVSSYELRLQRANGDIVHTLITGSPRYQGERIIGSIVVTTDLTEQIQIQLERESLLRQMKEKNEELERSTHEIETLRQSAAIVASTLDQEQTINLILEQLERVIPYTSASVQLICDNELEIVGGRGSPKDSGVIGTRFPINENAPGLAVIQSERPYVLFDDIQASHVEFQQPPHNYIHSWIAVPLKVKDHVFGLITVDGDQVGQFTPRDALLVSVFADQVAIALENSRLYSALQTELAVSEGLVTELENKNAELERFTYTVSHDLKSPLITIRGFLGYLEQDARAGNIERLTNDIERISKAAEKMYLLLDELLELSRIGRLMNEPEEVPFETIVREALSLAAGRLQNGKIKAKIGSNLPQVYGDRVRLVEVVQNLVDNAAKFTKNQPKPKIEIGVHVRDGKPIFYVKDNGIGIDPKYHEKIFGLFDKLDSSSEGTGVGLALVKRIVEVHGGKIWVESEAGKGATFCFTLLNKPKSGAGK